MDEDKKAKPNYNNECIDEARLLIVKMLKDQEVPSISMKYDRSSTDIRYDVLHGNIAHDHYKRCVEEKGRSR